ncbi:PLP-dependent aminotransferase family protein [Pseudomonas sp. F1_0610]|uniref:aminotransferase-like domain-containing protein n=1 Tax=Pseudomonas sp. F1_0610 TaxID=3114284 RepID=UPI0039C270FE
MPTTLDLQDNRPLYYQLSEKLAHAIQTHVFKAGARFPSVRRTAKTYSVSINTVIAAYRHLEDQGFIEARPQSGFYIRNQLPKLEHTLTSHSVSAAPKPNVLRLIDTTFAAQQNPEFTNISLACPTQDSDFYPREKLGKIMTQLLRQQPQLVGSYALPPGSLNLRQQIARRMLDLGIVTDANEVTITHGCVDALHLALRAVTKAGDCVGLESPTYFYLMPLLASMGLTVLEIPTHAETGLSIEAVEMLLEQKRIQAIICMPNLHNPLGCSMPLAAKKRLAQLVNQYEIPLIEDGLYCELQFDQVLPAVKTFDKHGWVMFCSSFTKTLAPDFRIGWISAGRFSQSVQQLKNMLSVAESQLLCETIAQFLAVGGYDHHLRKLRKRYSENMNQAQAIIAQHFPKGTCATKPQGGFVFWVELPGKIDTVELHQQLLKEHICLTPGMLYSPSGRFSNALRISCCYPFNEQYKYALARTGSKACEMTGISAGLN